MLEAELQSPGHAPCCRGLSDPPTANVVVEGQWLSTGRLKSSLLAVVLLLLLMMWGSLAHSYRVVQIGHSHW